MSAPRRRVPLGEAFAEHADESLDLAYISAECARSIMLGVDTPFRGEPFDLIFEEEDEA